jgi:hypothetical protein
MKHAKIIAFSSMALGTIACTVEADVDKNVDKAPKAPVTPEMDKDPPDVKLGKTQQSVRWYCERGYVENVTDCRSGTCEPYYAECNMCSWWELFFFGGCWTSGYSGS